MQTKQNVNPAKILEELNHLWESQPELDHPKACLFNLIVYTQDAKRTIYFQEIIKLIIEQFPCRVIFIQGNPASKDSDLRIEVSTKKGVNDHGITCDQIFIEAKGQELARVPFIILPLYVPDLPIYLLWGQDPTTEHIILPHLQRFANRLIFDSEATDDLQQYSQKLLTQMKSCSTDIVDMNWARIGGWREVVAQTYDSPERFEQLATATKITVIYNNIPNELFSHACRQAIYLQAWMASRLDWKFKNAMNTDHTFTITYESPKGEHQICLLPEMHESFGSEEILGLDISGPNNYECHIMRTDTNQVKVSASNQYQCELPFSLMMTTLSSGRNFMQEIFYQKASDQYVPMLKLISLFKWGS